MEEARDSKGGNGGRGGKYWGMELARDMAFGDEEGVMAWVTGGWLPRW